MIEDIQEFNSISKDEDTKVETCLLTSFELSQIDVVSADGWDEWENTDPKTNVFLKSGLEITLLLPYQEVASLWKRYKSQEKKAALNYRFN